MTTNEILSNVISPHLREYNVTLKNGKRKKIIMMRNGSEILFKRYKAFYYIWHANYDEWESVSLAKEVDNYALFMKRCRDAKNMLTKSGLWTSIKQDLLSIITLDSIAQHELVDMVVKGNDLEGSKFEGLISANTYNLLDNFILKKCWKSVNYESFERKETIENIESAIKERLDFDKEWRKGYDNSIGIRFNHKKNEMQGAYSEEYKDCGNGHYYLLFDATHAIFYEDD